MEYAVFELIAETRLRAVGQDRSANACGKDTRPDELEAEAADERARHYSSLEPIYPGGQRRACVSAQGGEPAAAA